MQIIRVDEMPAIKDRAAAWFAEKWKGHQDEYRSSIHQSINKNILLPKWYIMLEDGQVIAGAGVISNDPPIQKEQRPTVCAVYVEEQYRGKGIAGALLEYLSIDMMFRGVEALYLTTELDTFYERYGWQFMTEIKDSEDKIMRVYRRQLNFTGR